ARTVRAQVALAQKFGGETTRLLENTPVRRIDLEADRPTVVTDDGVISADRLIVTAGPWTMRLVPGWPVPLRPTRQQVLYFRPADPAPFRPGRLPVFIHKGPGAAAGRPDVLVASPCSGHGFKFSCLVGRVLADLATNGATDLDVAAWRVTAPA